MFVWNLIFFLFGDFVFQNCKTVMAVVLVDVALLFS